MKEMGENYKEEYDLDLFMETSAKTGLNSQELFVEAAKLLYSDYNTYLAEKKKSKVKTLNNDNNKPKKKQCCS